MGLQFLITSEQDWKFLTFIKCWENIYISGLQTHVWPWGSAELWSAVSQVLLQLAGHRFRQTGHRVRVRHLDHCPCLCPGHLHGIINTITLILFVLILLQKLNWNEQKMNQDVYKKCFWWTLILCESHDKVML